jgi:hypothetical protein
MTQTSIPGINNTNPERKKKKKKKIKSTHFNQNPLTSSKPDCNTSQPSFHVAGTSSRRDHSSADRNPHVAENFPLATPCTTNLNLHHGNTENNISLCFRGKREEEKENRTERKSR